MVIQRLSLEERYRGVDDYLQRIRRSAMDLIRRRYLLAEDLDSILERARTPLGIRDGLDALTAVDGWPSRLRRFTPDDTQARSSARKVSLKTCVLRESVCLISELAWLGGWDSNRAVSLRQVAPPRSRGTPNPDGCSPRKSHFLNH